MDYSVETPGLNLKTLMHFMEHELKYGESPPPSYEL